MAEYTDLDGVRTWYDERGDGEPLVLLHGGFGDARTFCDNLDALAENFHLYLPERRGHGHTPDVEGPLTVSVMARDTVAFLEKVVGGSARLVGYSAGATVALAVALERPDLVERLVLISGAFDLDGMIVSPRDGVGELPDELVRMYAEVSPDGVEHLPVVMAKIAEAAREEPGFTEADLAGITCRTLVLSGDDDLVTLEHTLALYRGIANSELAVVPGASHVLLLEKPAQCTAIVADFLTGEPVPTIMPFRRSGSAA
ncbi:alpha/beta fold hydrolase [Prauserella cavernicola]|uniref:Alpha/beta hydrolase n=1 Tax=Prauserella cavernicola TaxID=2800127 RepID=A0A934QRK7_9PSEU|nr:alpha/beta hydrolase [Prauserella cavernicola]MBK1784863.1 alpha/beta hydrolase [Prauserella cavernicola]